MKANKKRQPRARTKRPTRKEAAWALAYLEIDRLHPPMSEWSPDDPNADDYMPTEIQFYVRKGAVDLACEGKHPDQTQLNALIFEPTE